MKRTGLQDNTAVSQIRALANSLSETEPATSELLLLAADRIEKISGCLQNASAEGMTATRSRDFKRWTNDFSQVASWIVGGSPPPPTAAELVSSLNENISLGWSPGLAIAYMDVQRKGRRGKPPTAARQEGLAVLNLLRLQPKTPWNQVARRCCRCGKTRHDRKCALRLQAQQRELKNFIARLLR